MAIRRINFTGRMRINQTDTRFSIHKLSSGDHAFNAELDLADYGLPSKALVFVEAYRQTSRMRFPFGTVGNIITPAVRDLTEFLSPEGILFQVKITSPTDPAGVLLAEADRVRPRLPEERDENRIPLLTPIPDDSLGDEIFRVTFDDGPELLINKALGDCRAVWLNPIFISLVLPTAMRGILTRILHVERYSDLDDDNWKSQWLRFVSLLPGGPGGPPELTAAEIDDWIEEAVSAFARRFQMLSRFRQSWNGEAPA
jgi:hypothetical protein